MYPGLVLQGRYRVLQQLGKGGLSQTFDIDDRGTVKVLKVLTLDRFYDDDSKQKAIARFNREAEVLIRLTHPGVPKVDPDGYFTEAIADQEPLHCLVMEKIIGLNLSQWLQNQGNQPIEQTQAIAWLEQLCSILSRIHQEGLIHRDIKPSNIMLKPNGQLVLIDFGGVREVTETYSRTATGSALISLGYSPTEQIEGRAVFQSDFFAIGRTFVHLLTGRTPSEFIPDSNTGKLLWHDSAPQISKSLAELIDYLMAQFPGRRPQTIQEILRHLTLLAAKDPKSQSPKRDAIQPSQNAIAPPKQELFRTLVNFLQPPADSPNIWEKAALVHTFEGHTSGVSSIAISPDNQVLASGSYDCTIKLWSVQTKELLNTLKGHRDRVTSIAISPNAQLLASSSYDGTIKLWSLRTGDLLHTLTGNAGRIHSITFSPNSRALMGSSGQGTQLWDVYTGKQLRVLESQHSKAVRIVTFSPDGRSCVVGSLDGTMELWNPNIGRFLRAFPGQIGGVTSLAFSKDGQFLASSIGRKLLLWNPATGELLNVLSSQAGTSISVTFSPDGQTLASGGDKDIELWHPHTGKLLWTLQGHTDSVRSVAFSPDGSKLISGSFDKTIRLWRPVSNIMRV